MPLHVERQPDAESFLERAGPFLLEREAEHNLILGLTGRLRTNPRLYGEEPYFAVVLDTAVSLRPRCELRRATCCSPYTDLANPTSNSIYPRVGYEPVTDVDLLTFT